MRIVFPFSAIVGQEEMKLALLIAAVDQTVGGVLVFGDRGTGKSTAIRALAALLPPMRVVVGCRYNCDPTATTLCDECQARQAKGALKRQTVPVPVVDLPLGAVGSGTEIRFTLPTAGIDASEAISANSR